MERRRFLGTLLAPLATALGIFEGCGSDVTLVGVDDVEALKLYEVNADN